MPETVLSNRPADIATAALKVPPHSIEAEQSVLGGLMLDNAAWDRVADVVSEQDFYRHDHRLIFQAIGALSDQARPFDVVTISERLASHGRLDEAGGLAQAKQALAVAEHTNHRDTIHRCMALLQSIELLIDGPRLTDL